MGNKLQKLWQDYGDFIKELSNGLGIEPAKALAVLSVESGGNFFGDSGKPIIRFENHIFWKQFGQNNPDVFDAHFTPRTGWKGHMFRENQDDSWMTFHGDQKKEWQVMTFAITLDGEAALKSASWGAAQIMGFNYKIAGYASAVEMVAAFSQSAEQQIEGFFNFITGTGGVHHLASGDFHAFAMGYNGSGNADQYATWIEQAYEVAQGIVGA